MSRISVRHQLPRDLLWVLAAASLAYTVWDVNSFGIGYDSHAYWLAGRSAEMYDRAPGDKDAFLYSPAFAQLVWPLARLPWPVFATLFTALPALSFGWLFSHLRWRVGVPLWLATLPEIVSGNIYWLLALVAVVGIRHPACWSVAVLTKVTPGVGAVWFVVRRDWSNLFTSVVSTLVVVAVSAVIDPDAWRGWIAFLYSQSGATGGVLGLAFVPPLVVRLPIALLVVILGAMTGRRTLIPVAMVLATPVFGVASLTILAAIPRLRGAAADRLPRAAHRQRSRSE